MKLAKLGKHPEIFHTIQGEGPSVGMPAVFIRAALCNLHCIWCDSDHTWNFENSPWPHQKDAQPAYRKHRPSDVTIDIDPIDAAKLILSFSCPRVVITGGEPLLQQMDFLTLIHLIRDQIPDAFFELETNATRIPSAEFAQALDQFNVSPKLSNSDIHESLRIDPEVIHFFARSPKAWFKFVVSTPADLAEVLSIHTRFAIPRERILLMPEGRTSSQLDRSAPWLAEICRDLGFRFSDRLQIRLWGERPGT